MVSGVGRNKFVFVLIPINVPSKSNPSLMVGTYVMRRDKLPKREHIVIDLPKLDEIILSNKRFSNTVKKGDPAPLDMILGMFDSSKKLLEISNFYLFRKELDPVTPFEGKGFAAKIESKLINWLRKKCPGVKITNTGMVFPSRERQLRAMNVDPYAEITLNDYLRKLQIYRRQKRAIHMK